MTDEATDRMLAVIGTPAPWWADLEWLFAKVHLFWLADRVWQHRVDRAVRIYRKRGWVGRR